MGWIFEKTQKTKKKKLDQKVPRIGLKSLKAGAINCYTPRRAATSALRLPKRRLLWSVRAFVGLSSLVPPGRKPSWSSPLDRVTDFGMNFWVLVMLGSSWYCCLFFFLSCFAFHLYNFESQMYGGHSNEVNYMLWFKLNYSVHFQILCLWKSLCNWCYWKWNHPA